MTTNEPINSEGLVAAVQEAHEHIKSLLNDVAAKDGDRKDVFDELAQTIAAHETAEQQVVHPLTEYAGKNESVAEDCIAEEHKGEQVLDDLKRIGVNDPQFDETFSQFREAVLKHATHEETNEHPILERTLSGEVSRQAAQEFRAAQSLA
jgi:hypothetical protein